MDWGTGLAILLGASLSFGGGLLARNLEIRRQARRDILHLIADVKVTLTNLTDDPFIRDLVNQLLSQSDRLMRHADIAGWDYAKTATLLESKATGLSLLYDQWKNLGTKSAYEDPDVLQKDRERKQQMRDRASTQLLNYEQVLIELDTEIRSAVTDARSRWHFKRMERQDSRAQSK